MNIATIKHFISQLQGIDSSGEYISENDGIYCRTDKKSEKNLRSEQILVVVDDVLQSLPGLVLAPVEKARLATNLDSGLADLQARIHKNLRVRISSAFGYISPIDKELQARRNQAQKDAAHYSTLPNPLVEKVPEAFTKKLDPVQNFSSQHALFGLPVVDAILTKLSKDSTFKKVIGAWHAQSTHKNHALNKAMALELDNGTCYGQSMKILEIIEASNRSELSAEFIHKKMTFEDYVQYQILHILDCFVQNQNSKFFFGILTETATQKLNLAFPQYNKPSKSSEMMHLDKLDTDTFIGRLSDFIKIDIRSNQSTHGQKDYAILITLKSRAQGTGHAAIIHYSETLSRFFWYDPYRSDYGMFSTTDKQHFIKGAATKIMEYKNAKYFDKLYLSAYRV